MRLKIKELREEMQMTQKELADKVNNMQRNVSNWENGTSQPDLETIVKLADAFEVTLDELFGRIALPAGVQPSTAEQQLLRAFRRLPAEKRQVFLQFLETFCN